MQLAAQGVSVLQSGSLEITSVHALREGGRRGGNNCICSAINFVKNDRQTPVSVVSRGVIHSRFCFIFQSFGFEYYIITSGKAMAPPVALLQPCVAHFGVYVKRVGCGVVHVISGVV